MKFLQYFLTSVLAMLACAVQAQEYEIKAIPTAWRIQNYVSDYPVVWYSGSACSSGALVTGGNWAKVDRDRFFATIALAKANSQRIFVYYSIVNSSCVVNSFGFEAQ